MEQKGVETLQTHRNEWSFSAAQRWNWREHHNRDWWRRNNYRLVRYGGGYWYWK